METARIFFGLAAALVAPFGLGWQRSRPGAAMLATFLYGAYAIGPYMDHVRPWSALCVAFLVTAGVTLRQRRHGAWSLGFSVTLPLGPQTPAASRRLGAVALAAALALSAWTAWRTAASLGAEALESDRSAVFASALLVSVLGGGILAKAATGPVRREIEALPDTPERAAAMEFMSGGPAIGRLERGLLFAFLAAGQPEAAALVLAAKSLARVPNAEHGKHASEYFLIGTLASVIAALTMSMAARAAIGLAVLQGPGGALVLAGHPLIRELLTLRLPVADYVVTGSGPLLAHGLRGSVRDLDVVARGAAWETVLRLGEPVEPASGYGRLVPLFDGDIEVFDRWLPGSPGPDRMIEAAERVQGIPFSPLADVLAWKGRLGRQKDQQDIKLIRDRLGHPNV